MCGGCAYAELAVVCGVAMLNCGCAPEVGVYHFINLLVGSGHRHFERGALWEGDLKNPGVNFTLEFCQENLELWDALAAETGYRRGEG